MKLKSLVGVNLPKITTRIEYKDEGGICLVYSIWSHEAYANICYYSILSQLTYTDIQRYKILIFVDTHIEGYTRSLLNNLVPQENIISIREGIDCAKHNICLRPELQSYEVVTISDADNLIQSTAPVTLYEQILAIHQQSPQITFLKRDPYPLPTFIERYKLSEYRDYEDYEKDFKAIQPYLSDPTNYWYYSGLMSYNTSFITEEYKQFTESLKKHRFFCDETVWLTYTELHNIKRSTFLKEFNSLFITPETLYRLMNKEPNVIYLVHPFLGHHSNILQQAFLGYTYNMFKEKFDETNEENRR